jgi:hypothetical protein
MNDALSLVGFYFTLIGFVGGLFFTRLDSWYGSVRQFKGKVVQLRRREEFESANAEASGLQESQPKGSFISVGILLSLLVLLGVFVPVTGSSVSPILFLYVPMTVIVAAYWVGGFVLLHAAGKLLAEAQTVISQGLSG